VPREQERKVREAVEAWAQLWETIVEISHRNREEMGRSMRRRKNRKGVPQGGRKA